MKSRRPDTNVHPHAEEAQALAASYGLEIVGTSTWLGFCVPHADQNPDALLLDLEVPSQQDFAASILRRLWAVYKDEWSIAVRFRYHELLAEHPALLELPTDEAHRRAVDLKAQALENWQAATFDLDANGLSNSLDEVRALLLAPVVMAAQARRERVLVESKAVLACSRAVVACWESVLRWDFLMDEPRSPCHPREAWAPLVRGGIAPEWVVLDQGKALRFYLDDLKEHILHARLEYVTYRAFDHMVTRLRNSLPLDDPFAHLHYAERIAVRAYLLYRAAPSTYLSVTALLKHPSFDHSSVEGLRKTLQRNSLLAQSRGRRRPSIAEQKQTLTKAIKLWKVLYEEAIRR